MPSEINLKPTGSYFEIAKGNASPICGRTWGTPSDCHSAALLVHGLGANSTWFEAAGRRLKVQGVYAMAYDQIGFGKRKEQKLTSYKQWLDDLQAAWLHLKTQIGDKPVFLLGNSMGAVVALAAANTVKPDGLILTSPGFEGQAETFNLWFRVTGIVQALLQPDKLLTLPYTVDMVSRDEAARNFMEAEVGKRMTVKGSTLLEVLKLGQATRKQVTSISSPVFMFTAGRDQIVSNAASTETFNRLQAPEKKRRHYAEAYHDLMFDPVIDELVDELVKWIKQSTPLSNNVQLK
jgi:alpha-beta hydrolase superfamily lysophospholipase